MSDNRETALNHIEGLMVGRRGMKSETFGNGGFVLDMTDKGMRDFFQLARLKGMVKLECAGLKMSRGFSAYAEAKRRYGLKGSKASVAAQLEAMVEDALETKRLNALAARLGLDEGADDESSESGGLY
jgi:hypothetical protein